MGVSRKIHIESVKLAASFHMFGSEIGMRMRVFQAWSIGSSTNVFA
jgi:hypothetical protein